MESDLFGLDWSKAGGNPVARREPDPHQPPRAEWRHGRQYQASSMVLPSGSVVAVSHDAPVELQSAIARAVGRAHAIR